MPHESVSSVKVSKYKYFFMPGGSIGGQRKISLRFSNDPSHFETVVSVKHTDVSLPQTRFSAI